MTTCTLYHGPGFTIDPDPALGPSRPADELLAVPSVHRVAAVLLVDASLLERVADVKKVPSHTVLVAVDAAAAASLGDRAALSLAGLTDPAARRALLGAACRLAAAQLNATLAEEEFQALSRISIGLMRERDRGALLQQIVDAGKRLTHSDGAVLLLLTHDSDGTPWLEPKLFDFDSIPGVIQPQDRRIPVDSGTIVGYATVEKHPLRIADAYELPREADYQVNLDFDRRYSYRRRSMLVVPMIDQAEQVMGVLLLINRKTNMEARITDEASADRFVIQYSDRELRLARTLASQAAVAIENARLHAQVEHLLESFVRAAVSAIDLRDPATAGHSLRTAELVVSLAEAVERDEAGPYRDVHFTTAQLREIRFAALLHDFGKVAVREEVLLKAKKLPPALWERINARFDLIRRTTELQSCATRTAGNGLPAQLQQIDHWREVVREANEPTVLRAPVAAELFEIAKHTFEEPDGSIAHYLTEDELHFLELPQGTLDEHERAEVEAHVTKTCQFLANIPWTPDLANLVDYAYSHHEKLDGTGYPRRLSGKSIALATRMISIADMFDALTAPDRPYKPALSPEQALDLLQKEATEGRLDSDLVHIMAETKPYNELMGMSWEELLSRANAAPPLS